MYNKVQILGYLGSDPELRYTTTNKPVCNFPIATSEKYKDSNNQTHENTQWHRIVAWNKLGELCNTYLKKGSLVLVEGKLRNNGPNEVNRDGKIYVYNTSEIVISDIKFLPSKNNNNQQQNNNNQQNNRQQNRQSNQQPYNQQPYNQQNRQPYGNSQPQQPNHQSYNQSSYNQPPPFDDNYIPTDPGDDDIPF